MSTNRVSPSSSMLELVRALSSARGGATMKTGVSKSAAQEARGRARDLSALHERLSAILERLNPEDEQVITKLRRPVLQEIVLWEFGPDFRQHSEFVPMLDTIERAFDADPKGLARFTALIRELKR